MGEFLFFLVTKGEPQGPNTQKQLNSGGAWSWWPTSTLMSDFPAAESSISVISLVVYFLFTPQERSALLFLQYIYERWTRTIIYYILIGKVERSNESYLIDISRNKWMHAHMQTVVQLACAGLTWEMLPMVILELVNASFCKSYVHQVSLLFQVPFISGNIC